MARNREQFEQTFGPQPSLGRFVRSLIGLDRDAARQAFARFLQGGGYSEKQIRFVNQIIDYLTKHGAIDLGRLYEQPFTRDSANGLDGVFPQRDADEITAIINAIASNAAGAGALS